MSGFVNGQSPPGAPTTRRHDARSLTESSHCWCASDPSASFRSAGAGGECSAGVQPAGRAGHAGGPARAAACGQRGWRFLVRAVAGGLLLGNSRAVHHRRHITCVAGDGWPWPAGLSKLSSQQLVRARVIRGALIPFHII